MFAIVMCLVLLMCTLTIGSSVMCLFMVECMSVIVNVILCIISVVSPPAALCNLKLCTLVKLCALGIFALGVSLVYGIVMISACVS